jgi:ribonuclease HI
MLHGITKAQTFLQSAFHAELLGCVEGLKMAAQMGMARVILEIDTSMVNMAIEGDDLSALIDGRCHH